MGEAKRRKISDPTYGKQYKLDTNKLLVKHKLKLIEEFQQELLPEMAKFLATDESKIILANYPEVSNTELLQDRFTERFRTWFEAKMQNYSKENHNFLAVGMMDYIATVHGLGTIPLVSVVCFIDAMQVYFTEEEKVVAQAIRERLKAS